MVDVLQRSVLLVLSITDGAYNFLELPDVHQISSLVVTTNDGADDSLES